MKYATNEELLPALQRSFDSYYKNINNDSDLLPFQKHIIIYYNDNDNKKFFANKENKETRRFKKYKKYKNYYKNYLQIKDRQLKNKSLDIEIINLFPVLVKNAIQRLPYTNPLDRIECERGALMDLLFYWTSFNIKERTNPFAYFTSVVYMGCAKEFKRLKINKNKFFISFDHQSSDDDDNYTIYSI